MVSTINSIFYLLFNFANSSQFLFKYDTASSILFTLKISGGFIRMYENYANNTKQFIILIVLNIF